MNNITYKIVDTLSSLQNNKIYQKKDRKRINNKINKLNNEYGCYRYIVKTIIN